MLLFVIERELEQIGGVRVVERAGLRQPFAHRVVDLTAIDGHLRIGGSRESRLRWLQRDPRTDALIVEELNRRSYLGSMGARAGDALQQDLFKEPGGVRHVPLHRGSIRHGLGQPVLGRQRFAQAFAPRAHGLEADSGPQGSEASRPRRRGRRRRRGDLQRGSCGALHEALGGDGAVTHGNLPLLLGARPSGEAEWQMGYLRSLVQ